MFMKHAIAPQRVPIVGQVELVPEVQGVWCSDSEPVVKKLKKVSAVRGVNVKISTRLTINAENFAWSTLDTLAQHHTSLKNGRKVMVLRCPKC